MSSVSIIIQIQLIANLRDCYYNTTIKFEADFDMFDRNQLEIIKKLLLLTIQNVRFLLNHT